jgi:hypothetical protein
LRVDRGDDQIVGDPSLYQLDDGVVVQRLLGDDEGAQPQEDECEKALAHADSPCFSERNAEI